ncbi:hypothetical protein DAPPUDRAFT_115184 [Daphnia pulex]|uniref:Uncharacterized protein n=1 Tax=Daphnia pulex TaxID=6669 RepID=E9HKI5_DAPPU|nr:hypothetical protein DAPPUDRAFT_115184 [Daphnia pulex]|eukprot:EFX67753.1 hypothetical protein DAPPUDRAFT_115184 [Daphnia pulex]
MGHQLNFEAVVQNLDRVRKTLRLVLTAFAVPSMTEAVTKWLPLCPRQRAFFLHLLFVQAIFPDVDMENFPDCVFQCVDLLDFYYDRYPGCAKYRDVLSFHQARFLWYVESGIDVCYPSPRHAVLYPEKLSLHSGDRLSILDTRRQLEESALIERFMSVYEPRHLLTAQLIRHYSNMSEPHRSRHRANMYYTIQAETVFEDLLLLLPSNGRRRPRPY